MGVEEAEKSDGHLSMAKAARAQVKKEAHQMNRGPKLHMCSNDYGSEATLQCARGRSRLIRKCMHRCGAKRGKGSVWLAMLP